MVEDWELLARYAFEFETRYNVGSVEYAKNRGFSKKLGVVGPND
jgi:hypothetical protein